MSVSSSGWAPGSSVGSAGMLRWQQAACLSGPSGGPPERHKYNEKFAYKGEEGEGGGVLENEISVITIQKYSVQSIHLLNLT